MSTAASGNALNAASGELKFPHSEGRCGYCGGRTYDSVNNYTGRVIWYCGACDVLIDLGGRSERRLLAPGAILRSNGSTPRKHRHDWRVIDNHPTIVGFVYVCRICATVRDAALATLPVAAPTLAGKPVAPNNELRSNEKMAPDEHLRTNASVAPRKRRGRVDA